MNNFLQRTLSGALYTAILMGGIWWKPQLFVALLFLLQLMCLIETLTLLNLNRVLPRTLAFFLGLAGFSLMAWHFIEKWQAPAWLTNVFLMTGALHVLALMYITFMPSMRVRLIKVDWLHATLYTLFPFTAPLLIFHLDSDYRLLMTLVFVLIWVHDTFAYLVGKWLGKTPLIERLSPKKTVEGLAGGVVFTLLVAALVIPAFTPKVGPVAMMGMAIIAIAGSVIGDLYESKLKRRAEVKDSGWLIPGHGGILDRLDSFLFVMPLMAVYYYLFLL